MKLDRFKLRPYQEPIWDALENKGYKRILAILPRRAGKDICCLNLMLRQALKKVGIYYYLLPTYSQARKTLWDSLTNTGVRFMDYIPKELIANMNSTEMKVRLVNDSLIQFLGSDNFDSLVGTNPSGCVFSEYALQDPRAYQFLRPALTATQGWAIFISTPRGKNHLWEMWNIAQQNQEDWFAYKLTVEETNHIPLHEIQKELASGEMSEDLVQQEYYCSFDQGVEGSYYGKYLDRMRIKGQISVVPFETGFKVHTAWDLGVRDATAIVFFQVTGQVVRIIDFYENTKQGLEHYAKVLDQKRRDLGYMYGRHIGPHDIRVQEFGTGLTRVEQAKRLGIDFTIAPNLSIEDGIEAVRAAFSKFWIDEKNCALLIKHLENYRQEFDAKKKVYKSYPLHDVHSNACFVGETLVKTSKGDKPIKDIQVNDLVVTPLGLRKVLDIHKRMTSETLCVTVGKTIIECTREHEIFCGRGLVYSDTLRYNDVLESYNKIKGYLWPKIFGYYTEGYGIKGFKKAILSLRMNHKSCLMGTFLHGMRTIIDQASIMARDTQLCNAISGHITMVKYLKTMLFTIKMVIRRIIPLKILNVCTRLRILVCMLIDLVRGHNLKSAKTSLEVLMLRPQNGMGAMREGLGIESTPKTVCPLSGDLNTIKSASVAIKNTRECKPGKNTVLMRAKQKLVFSRDWTLLSVLAVFVKTLSLVTNTALRRHVVKSVEINKLCLPVEVYDLTVETDNCYYANGYLVSNSDAMRYLSISLSKVRDGLSPEDLERRYQEAMHGSQGQLPDMFRDEYKI